MLTKTITERILINVDRTLTVETLTTIYDNNVVIAQTTHGECITPRSSTISGSSTMTALINLLWTPEMRAAYEQKMTAAI